MCVCVCVGVRLPVCVCGCACACRLKSGSQTDGRVTPHCQIPAQINGAEFKRSAAEEGTALFFKCLPTN